MLMLYSVISAMGKHLYGATNVPTLALKLFVFT